ncbi:MAG: hydrogenase iron-sulfur subunit [Verrucomicrobiota bacterium]
MARPAPSGGTRPKILVFSTNNISDPGIDLAGSQHMSYSPSVKVISVPCSGGIHPNWIVHALEAGFDGVFIAADGGDCAYLPDCTERTARVAEKAQKLLRETGRDPRRVKMAAICSVCSEPFVSHMRQFTDALGKL